jgi:mannose-6-phosphate isomerase-like protein (cupin superfamily)
MIKLLKPDINLDTLKDGRGGIFTYYPEKDTIKEWSYIVTFKGEQRGHHYHEEFDEYILLIEGHGCYFDDQGNAILIGSGDCIYLPQKTKHTFMPLSDCKMVAMLTKRWDQCEKPITKS